jgi:hypothetical protein
MILLDPDGHNMLIDVTIIRMTRAGSLLPFAGGVLGFVVRPI